MTRSAASLALVTTLALVACGDASTAPVHNVRALRAIQIDAPPVAVVASAVQVRIQIVDLDAKPVAGQIVNFVVVGGGGSVYAATGLTDGSGTVAEVWTLGTVSGVQSLEARAVDPETGEPLLLGTASATAVADAAVTVNAGDVVLWPSEHRDLAAALNARDRFGNVAKLVPDPATKFASGAFVLVGDSVIAPDTIGQSTAVSLVVAGVKQSVRVFTAPNFAARAMTYRSACPMVGYDSVVQVTTQDPVTLAADRLSFTWTGRTTTLAYWLGGKTVNTSGPSHTITTGAVPMTIRPDTLKSSLELFVRKGDAARYLQTRFIQGAGACGVAPFSAAYSVE